MQHSDVSPIKVGFVGLSAKGSWAQMAHLPAFSTPHYTLHAVQNSSLESAQASAKKYNVPLERAYGSINDLVADKDVQLVVVSVKVPHHYSLVVPALEAKKDVFCEWPLGRTTEEAETMAELAQKNGVRTMVGLQARQSPVVKKLKEIISSGKIGKVLSTTLVASGQPGGWGPTISEEHLYLIDNDNGANMITIPAGHTMDALAYVLGEFESLSAVTRNHFPTVSTVTPDGQVIKEGITKTAADQLLVSGVLESGATVSVHYRAGIVQGTGLFWEINGTDGTIIMKGSSGHLQMFSPTLVLHINGIEEDLTPPAESLGIPQVVGKEYEAFATKGEYVTFEEAVIRHRMIDAIIESAETGKRTTYKTTY